LFTGFCCWAVLAIDLLRRDSLDQRELKGRLSAKYFKAADPDNDGTLDKNAWVVETRESNRATTGRSLRL
jgi:hypothetical protein